MFRSYLIPSPSVTICSSTTFGCRFGAFLIVGLIFSNSLSSSSLVGEGLLSGLLSGLRSLTLRSFVLLSLTLRSLTLLSLCTLCDGGASL